MTQVRRWAGLDVHASSVLAATVDGVSGEMRTRRLSGKTSEGGGVLHRAAGAHARGLRSGADRLRIGARRHATGIGCVVAAPGKIERPPPKIASRPTSATPSACCGC